MKDNWISVDDILPDPYVNVLLLDIYENKYNVGFCKPCFSPKVYWASEDNIRIKNITHWQPLPEPPK